MTLTGRSRAPTRWRGRYRKKQEFIDAPFGRLAGALVGGVKLEVQHLFVDGETTIVELRSTSTTIEGTAFANTYCWVCRLTATPSSRRAPT
jgi:uncharacterized protein